MWKPGQVPSLKGNLDVDNDFSKNTTRTNSTRLSDKCKAAASLGVTVSWQSLHSQLSEMKNIAQAERLQQNLYKVVSFEELQAA